MPLWVIYVAGALFVLLIATVFHLHSRVKRLEEIVRRLEGVNGSDDGGIDRAGDMG
ncbi:MAG: hypothetical protein HY435_02240 [Candidatus Liptonbacteria bacterium]|nr:hypothetical protein [Candidatus Liptonbacteria bacterium]